MQSGASTVIQATLCLRQRFGGPGCCRGPRCGIKAPARPVPPFERLPFVPTAEEQELDQLYQAQCADWIEAVAQLHREHLPTLSA
ncbi:MAG: hypothetical protein EON54_18250 [Alcaligenaceae bacterium]|nr:MAG: hypothetical protein EON54_18250 [Alcaligenaceae bacterium]